MRALPTPATLSCERGRTRGGCRQIWHLGDMGKIVAQGAHHSHTSASKAGRPTAVARPWCAEQCTWCCRTCRMYTFAYSALLNPHESKWGIYHELVRGRACKGGQMGRKGEAGGCL